MIMIELILSWAGWLIIMAATYIFAVGLMKVLGGSGDE